MIHENVSVHASLVDYARMVKLWFFEAGPGLQDHVYEPVVFSIRSADRLVSEPVEPTLSLSYEFAQKLLDALIEAGLKPTQQGSAGHLGALKAHLEDMRKLVFEGIK